ADGVRVAPGQRRGARRHGRRAGRHPGGEVGDRHALGPQLVLPGHRHGRGGGPRLPPRHADGGHPHRRRRRGPYRLRREATTQVDPPMTDSGRPGPPSGGRTLKKGAAVVFALAAATLAAGCSSGSDNGPRASATTASTAPASSPTTAATASGPVTDADVAEVDQIIHRLDSELDRLDSDMATGEGEVQ